MTYRCRKCGKESTSNQRAYCSMSLQLPEECDWQVATPSLDELEALVEKAGDELWEVDPDDREGMEYNNHIVISSAAIAQHHGGRVCFMAHGGPDEQEQFDARAALIAALRNSAPSLIAAAREGERMREAAQNVIDQAQTSVTDHEGRQHAMEDDRGEALYLVQFEAIEQLRSALAKETQV